MIRFKIQIFFHVSFVGIRFDLRAFENEIRFIRLSQQELIADILLTNGNRHCSHNSNTFTGTSNERKKSENKSHYYKSQLAKCLNILYRPKLKPKPKPLYVSNKYVYEYKAADCTNLNQALSPIILDKISVIATFQTRISYPSLPDSIPFGYVQRQTMKKNKCKKKQNKTYRNKQTKSNRHNVLIQLSELYYQQ